jgi:hypothetical protein
MTREGLRRGAGRPELSNRKREMKDLVDKSKIGLGNLIVEVLAKINQQSVSFFFISAVIKSSM